MEVTVSVYTQCRQNNSPLVLCQILEVEIKFIINSKEAVCKLVFQSNIMVSLMQLQKNRYL